MVDNRAAEKSTDQVPEARHGGVPEGDVPDEVRGEGGFLVSKVHYLSRRILGALLRANGIEEFEPGQGRILFVLWQSDGIPITSLAERTALQKSSLTRTLDRLERAELVRREPHPTDRRTTRILLTDRAREMLGTFTAVSDQMRDIYYQGFTSQEIQIFESYLQRILTNLTAAPSGHHK